VCENIKVEASGPNYDDALLEAMRDCKDAVGELCSVFRDPEECKSDDDWFLAHSDCELSGGKTVVGGLFVFRRRYEEEL